MGVHALRGPPPAGRPSGVEERWRHMLHELRIAAAVLCTGDTGRPTHCAR